MGQLVQIFAARWGERSGATGPNPAASHRRQRIGGHCSRKGWGEDPPPPPHRTVRLPIQAQALKTPPFFFNFLRLRESQPIRDRLLFSQPIGDRHLNNKSYSNYSQQPIRAMRWIGSNFCYTNNFRNFSLNCFENGDVSFSVR